MTMRRFDRRSGALAVGVTAALIMAAAYVGNAKGDEDKDRDHDSYTIGLFGDMPYNALGRAQYPNLIADINANHVEFSVFDGDLKAGGDGPCADSLYTTAIAQFNTLKQPLVWLPGRQRLDGLLGPLRSQDAALLRFHRAAEFRAHPVHVHGSEPRPEDAQAHAVRRAPDTRRTSGGNSVPSCTSASTSRVPTTTIRTRGLTGKRARRRRSRGSERKKSRERRQTSLWLREGFEYAAAVRARGVMIDLAGGPELQQRATPGRSPVVGCVPRLRQRVASGDAGV